MLDWRSIVILSSWCRPMATFYNSCGVHLGDAVTNFIWTGLNFKQNTLMQLCFSQIEENKKVLRVQPQTLSYLWQIALTLPGDWRDPPSLSWWCSTSSERPGSHSSLDIHRWRIYTPECRFPRPAGWRQETQPWLSHTNQLCQLSEVSRDWEQVCCLIFKSNWRKLW